MYFPVPMHLQVLVANSLEALHLNPIEYTNRFLLG